MPSAILMGLSLTFHHYIVDAFVWKRRNDPPRFDQEFRQSGHARLEVWADADLQRPQDETYEEADGRFGDADDGYAQRMGCMESCARACMGCNYKRHRWDSVVMSWMLQFLAFPPSSMSL